MLDGCVSTTNVRRATAVLLVLPALASMFGCGMSSVPTAHLSGKVTLGGKPLPSDSEGSITFTLEGSTKNKGTVSVPINIGDSSYDSPDTPRGPVKAYFSIIRKGPAKMSQRTGQQYHDIINLVPNKYATGVDVEVEEDNSNQDFNL